MLSLSIPVYYTMEYVKKKPKTFLCSLNWFRNAHHFEQNKVKQHFHELLTSLLGSISPIKGQYKVIYTYFYKNKSSDMPNVTLMCSKWLNDTLQALSLVQNDNVQYLVEEIHRVGGLDKDNPRCEITIEEIPNEGTIKTA